MAHAGPPTISAVIPAYNRASTVGRAIDSVLAQSFPVREVIVVDDGSDDETASVVSAYGHSVRLIQQPNLGASLARNRGVEEARGEWIAFLDSDDYWLPGHLERIANAIETTAGRASVYFSDTKRTADDNGCLLWNLIGFEFDGPIYEVADARDWVMLPRQPMMLQSSVIRRSRYLEVGGLVERLVSRHDTHLFFKLGLGGRFCAVAGVGVAMTNDDSSDARVTVRYAPNTIVYAEETRDLYVDLLRSGHDLTPSERKTLRARLASALLHLGRVSRDEGRWAASALHVLSAAVKSPKLVTARAVRLLNPSWKQEKHA